MKRFILITLLLITNISVQAETIIEKVYLNEAIDIALKNNIDLEAGKINISIAKNEIKKANRLQNPSFDYYHFMGEATNAEPKQLGVSQNFELAKRYTRKNFNCC